MAYQEDSDYNRAPDLKEFLRPKYPVWVEALKVFLLFLAPCCLLTFAGYETAGVSGMAFSLPFYAMPWISTWLRRNVSNFFIFLLVHLLFGAWLILPCELPVRALGILYVILVTAYGMVRRLGKQAEREAGFAVMYAALALLFGMAIFMAVQETVSYNGILIIQSLGYVVLFLFYQHRLSIFDALRTMEGNSNFSTKRVTAFNTKMLWSYLSLAGIVFALLYVLGLGRILGDLGAWFMRAVRWLTQYLARDGDPSEEDSLAAVVDPDTDEPAPMLPDAEPWKIWVVLGEILEIAFIIVAAAAIIFGIYYVIKTFLQSRTMRVRRYQEDAFEETKEYYNGNDKTHKKRRRLADLFDNSPEGRIRRAYYRRVKSQIDRKVKRSDTPQEVGVKLADMKDLASQYNEVRYKDNVTE